LESFINQLEAVYLTGSAGTGKTLIVQNLLHRLTAEENNNQG
jgi:tRNA A37 threonylcarbamoyladenosine biosynthesis protein TsaE